MCFSTQPPAPAPARGHGSLHVNFRVILLSYRRLITRRLGNLVTLPCYCLLVITATPLRRLRYAVTRAPPSRSLRDGSGRLGTGPGRTRQSKPLYIHARTNWLVRQWALLHGPARAGPRWVSGGQELDREFRFECTHARKAWRWRSAAVEAPGEWRQFIRIAATPCVTRPRANVKRALNR